MINKQWTPYFIPARKLFPGIFFICLLCTACKNDPAEIKALTGKSSLQLDKAQDVTIIYSEHGQTKTRLFAHEFIRNENGPLAYTDMKNGVKAEFFDSALNVESVLTADFGRYYEKKGWIVMQGNVHVVNNKGEQLKTQQLVWNQNIHKFYTDKPVTIITPTQVINGDGLDANEDFTYYEIKNPKGSVLVNKNQVPQ